MRKKMRPAILFIGRSGSGKGTQSSILRGCFNWRILSSGNLLREEAKRTSERGLRIKRVLDEGLFADPEDIIYIIFKAIHQNHTASGLVFEGSPRTLREARWLDEALIKARFKPLPFWLDVSEEECQRRLLIRKRGDDTKAQIKSRFREFGKNFPLIKLHYGIRLTWIGADKKKVDVFRQIKYELQLLGVIK